MAEQRVESSPLDVPMSRRDYLDYLSVVVELSPLGQGRAVLARTRDTLCAQWSKPPVPEKLETSVTSEPHDGD